MNKFAVLTLASLLSATVLAGPVLSQGNPEIVVTSGRSTADLVAAVSADLDRQLFRVARGQRQELDDGIAVVRFECASDGTPDKVALIRRSGDADTDKVAIEAVERLASLHPLPAGVSDRQLFQANIIFADTWRQRDKLSRQLAREESARIASSGEERAVFAINAGSRIRS